MIGRQQPLLAGLAAPSVLLAVALAAQLLLRLGTGVLVHRVPDMVPVWAVAVLLPAAALAGVRWTALPLFARRFLAGTAIFLILYFGIEPFDLPYAAIGPDAVAARFHMSGRWVGLALALAALLWSRPSLLWASAAWLWAVRELQTPLTGFHFSTLDIRVVCEVTSFVAIGMALIAAARSRRAAALGLGIDEAAAARAALLIIAAGIGAHLGNYFWSAIAKLTLDGGPWSWLLGNQLYNSIPVALERGSMPWAAVPAVVQWLYDLFRQFAVPINFASFVLQLLAPLAAARRRWLIAITLGYDVFHLIVFLALGLFFWKWIALNIVIVATLAAMRDEDWRGLGAATAITFCLAGSAFFYTARLAWYDAPAQASGHFEARTDDGRSYRLPPAFFRSASYQASQAELWWPGGRGHFNPLIWGSAKRHADLEAGRRCQPPDRGARPASPFWGPPLAVARFAAANHRQLLASAGADGRADYYWLPHHHVPSPFVTDPVAHLDLRRIRAYTYVVESVCLSLDRGHLVRRVLRRTALPLYDVADDRLLPAATR